MSNTKNRVVITGFGTVNALGNSSEEYWERALAGDSGLQINNLFDVPNDMSKVNGFVNLDMEILPKELQKEDRAVQLAFKATEEAIKRSNLTPNNLRSQRVAVCLASAIGSINTMESALKTIVEDRKGLEYSKKKVLKNLKRYFNFNYLSKFIAEYYKITGENVVMATGCTGGLDSIGYAYNSIKSGETDIVITGSSEAPITPLVVSSFSKIKATSTRFNNCPEKASRPFDKDRDGFILSEGAGILILESLENALKRKAYIYGEVLGYGSCNNALHMTDIPSDGSSIAESMKLCLRDANISSTEIDFINLHGSSTFQNDKAESQALREVFGEMYNIIPVTSNKSQIGHSLSASNSIEVINCIFSLNTDYLSPTINIDIKDKDCDLNIVERSIKVDSINYILKNASGFSGIHSAVVIGKYKL
jgi:actinorhodin polyketide putative beta-ketoacyl synthase 1